MVASQPEATKTLTPPCLEVLEKNETMEKIFAIKRSVVSTGRRSGERALGLSFKGWAHLIMTLLLQTLKIEF